MAACVDVGIIERCASPFGPTSRSSSARQCSSVTEPVLIPGCRTRTLTMHEPDTSRDGRGEATMRGGRSHHGHSHHGHAGSANDTVLALDSLAADFQRSQSSSLPVGEPRALDITLHLCNALSAAQTSTNALHEDNKASSAPFDATAVSAAFELSLALDVSASRSASLAEQEGEWLYQQPVDDVLEQCCDAAVDSSSGGAADVASTYDRHSEITLSRRGLYEGTVRGGSPRNMWVWN